MVAAAIAGAAVVGAVGSSIASSNAADAQEQASQNASNTQMAMFNRIQGNEAPWVNSGQAATAALAQFYGLPTATPTASSVDPTGGYLVGGERGLRDIPGRVSIPTTSTTHSTTTASTPDYNKILSNLPGYQFQLQQGSQAVQRNLAAQGLLQSGAAGKALTQYGQGLAQNYAGQYAGGLATLSQLGEAGAAGVASAGINAANQIGSNQIYAGNAAAAGYANTANAVNTGLGGLASAYGYANQPNYGPSAANYPTYLSSAADTQSDPSLYAPAGGGGYIYNTGMP